MRLGQVLQTVYFCILYIRKQINVSWGRRGGDVFAVGVSVILGCYAKPVFDSLIKRAQARGNA
jgi:hypothetical protein